MTEHYAHTSACEAEEAARLLCWFQHWRAGLRQQPVEDHEPPAFMSSGELRLQASLRIAGQAEAAVYDGDCPVCGLPWKEQG